MPRYQAIQAGQRLPGRPFTDPERIVADIAVMDRMLARLRHDARSWAGGPTAVELLQTTDAGCRHWLVVPQTAALLTARRITIVGFFGDQRPGMDHAVIYQLEAEIVARLARYATAGLLSYYDAELDPGVHGNLVFFGTPEVPPQWHSDAVHARAVAAAPRHYRSVRLHRGAVSGPFLGSGGITVERTRYFDFGSEPAWYGMRAMA